MRWCRLVLTMSDGYYVSFRSDMSDGKLGFPWCAIVRRDCVRVKLGMPESWCNLFCFFLERMRVCFEFRTVQRWTDLGGGVEGIVRAIAPSSHNDYNGSLTPSETTSPLPPPRRHTRSANMFFRHSPLPIPLQGCISGAASVPSTPQPFATSPFGTRRAGNSTPPPRPLAFIEGRRVGRF